MANEITSSTTSSDQEKFLASKLISRSLLKMVASSVCKKVEQPKGTGATAYFIRYSRMNVPLSTLTEGTPPSNSSFSLEQFTVTLDQWGDVITLTDVAQLTTKHPLLQQAIDLLADNAARVIDREIQLVWLANTNVQYHDGTDASRSAISSTDYMTDTVMHKAHVTLEDAGAPPRGGPDGGFQNINAASAGSFTGGNHYLMICGPQVYRDVMQSSTSFGSWASAATYQSVKSLYNGEVGTWLNFRVVVTNFIPKFVILGNTTTAVASGDSGGITGLVVTAVDGGGSLTSATTYYWKVTRKDKTRGFEEAISIEHTTASAATGNNESFTFALPSTAGYVYNVYFGSATGDANLKLAAQNQEPSATVTVTAVPSSTVTAPANVNTTGTPTIHPVWVHAAESCMWVGLQSLQTFVSKDESTTHDPLKQTRKIGYKFMAKTIVPDSTRLLRIEVASRY